VVRERIGKRLVFLELCARALRFSDERQRIVVRGIKSKERPMTDKKRDVNIDSDKNTVIGLEGSELHHDLKNRPGEAGDPDHAKDGEVIRDSADK